MSRVTIEEFDSDGDSDFRSLHENILADLQKVLKAKDLPLYDMALYHFGVADKNLDNRGPIMKYGILAQLILMSQGKDTGKFYSIASALELINGFLEVHDDVQAGNPTREGRDALWWVWGPAQAINAGDAMNSLARVIIVGLEENGVSGDLIYKALQIVDQALIETMEGRFQDLEMQEKLDVSEDEYLSMSKSKRGALVGASLALGALFSGLNSEVQSNLIECGRNVGVASQINDDLKEILVDRDDGNVEFLNKKKLYPLVMAMNKAGPSQKRKLGEVYFKRVLLEEDLRVVREIIYELDVIDLCKEKLHMYKINALDSLADLSSDIDTIQRLFSHEFYGALHS